MSVNATPTPLGERTRIDIRAIEHELTELWKQAADSGSGEKGSAVTRTCVLTLLVVTHSGAGVQHATGTVARLMAWHPHRAIVVNSDPSAEAELLDAWVQAHCQMPGPGRPQVCCEQITVEAHGPAVARVHGIVLPLLVPDVPVALWCPRGEPFDDQRFERLTELADRAVVDSATFASPEAGLVRMAGMLSAPVAISDLSWSRLTPWRELSAQFFDAPAMVPHLAELERVVVEYEARAGEAADRSQALLLVGWLASRLGWRRAGAMAARGDGALVEMTRADGGAVSVELRPAEAKQDALDRLVSLSLVSRRARFDVRRGESPDSADAHAQIEGLSPLHRTVRLEHLDEAQLIAYELRLLGRDRTFEDALQVAAGLIAG